MLLSYFSIWSTTALFLLFTSFLPSTHAQLSPTPPVLLDNPTICNILGQKSSFWIIGSQNNQLVALNYDLNNDMSTTYTITDSKVNRDTGGKCIASNSTHIYYVSNANIGYITIESGVAKWTTIQKEGSKNGIGFFFPPGIALGSLSPDKFTAAIVENNSLNAYTFLLGESYRDERFVITSVGLDKSSDISDMAISGSFIWVCSASKQLLIQWDIIGKKQSNNYSIANIPNSRLAPFSDNTGVILLQDDVANGKFITTIFTSNKTASASTSIQRQEGGDKLIYWSPDQLSLYQIFPAPDPGFRFTALKQPLPTAPSSPSPTDTTPPISNPETNPKANDKKGIIIGSIIGVGVLLIAVAVFLVIRRRRAKGRGAVFARKGKDLFPSKNDESLVPLGLYHQNRSLPDIPKNSEYASQQYARGPNNGAMHANMMAAGAAPFLARHEQNSSQNTLEEHFPVEAALKHHRHDMHTPQGLTHSISVSSTTSKFPRRNEKGGKRFEEKIQLQVIRYEVQDAHLNSPHGVMGRLVLGTYHIISQPRSARSVKAQSGASRSLARSGTVVVRRGRIESGSGQGLPELLDDSTMLLTEAENQHTFETSTLKWYSTEIHWKREAALLKHLKSPIFVMELLESYCIPSLQNRANTYPFVNAMGGCSSLLSNAGPIKTAQHARSILRSISAAVDWCYRRGVVHLNIQPGSFFLEDGIDPSTEDAPWKLWDFTCARFIGEPIGVVGGGKPESGQQEVPLTPQPPPNHLQAEAYPYLEQRQVEERSDRTSGNPLPAAYSAPELLEAWRFGDETFPAETVMDTWSLGCVYYEVLTGQPLFATEADSWALVGGWDNRSPWTAKNFRVPYPPSATVSSDMNSTIGTAEQDMTDPFEKSRILDPSGSISQLLHDMLKIHADERITMETVMERIY
ncbi:hypothetical protein BGZ76_005587 [Entomortierella beljakovae]|nr:hypothetical protein BGZ76_005587 [Entomortierella beljakovae]